MSATDALIKIFVGEPVKVPSMRLRLRSTKRNIRRIVSSYASGNVLLQRGQYITRRDLEALREKNLNYDYGRSK